MGRPVRDWNRQSSLNAWRCGWRTGRPEAPPPPPALVAVAFGNHGGILGLVDLLCGKVLGGRYELRAELGRGAMGVVYEAWDVRLGRMTAVKVLTRAIEGDERSIRRFRREATVLARLSSPRLVQVFDCGETEEGTPYLVMELVRGIALDAALRQDELTVDASLRTVVEVCEGLQVAHEAGVVHRDLKPANVMLTDDGAKVVDFGVASIVTDELDRSASIVAGTPRTMSPEQLLGERTNARSDVFAIGVLAYRLFAGHYPFVADSMAAQMFAILRGHTPLHEVGPVSRSVSACVSKALSPDPSQRQQSAKAFADELFAAFDEEPRHSVAHRPTTSESDATETLSDGDADLITAGQSNASSVASPQGLPSSSTEEKHPDALPAERTAKDIRIWSGPGTAALGLSALALGLLAATYSPRAPAAAVPSSTAIPVSPTPEGPSATPVVTRPTATVAVAHDAAAPRQPWAPASVRLPRQPSAATQSAPIQSIPTEASAPRSDSSGSIAPLPKYL